MKKWMLVLLLFLLPLNLSAFPYICVVENSVGFNLNTKTGKWVDVDFTASGLYLISKPKNKDAKHIAEIKRVGFKEPESYCSKEVNQFAHLFDDVKPGRLTCDGRYRVKVYLPNLKFAVSSFGGYVFDPMDENASAFMSIGSCSPL